MTSELHSLESTINSLNQRLENIRDKVMPIGIAMEILNQARDLFTLHNPKHDQIDWENKSASWDNGKVYFPLRNINDQVIEGLVNRQRLIAQRREQPFLSIDLSERLERIIKDIENNIYPESEDYNNSDMIEVPIGKILVPTDNNFN